MGEPTRTLRSYAILIPAYNPDRQLVDLVEELLLERQPVIVVDDGSKAASSEVFKRIAGGDLVTLLRHEVNRGKGRAIKTGLAEVLRLGPDMVGVVLMDADGQHAGDDVRAVGALLEEGGERLVIGARQAAGHVPLRSRLGNSLTRRLFSLITGVRIQDTQTGLRGIPRGLIPALAALPGERYEYEMEMLFFCCAQEIPIVEVPIRTRYFGNNEASHFRPLVDSSRIYATLLRNWARPRRRPA